MMENWGRKVLPGLEGWEEWLSAKFAGAISIGLVLYDFDRFMFRIAFVDRTGKQASFDVSRFSLEYAVDVPREHRRIETFFMTGILGRLACS
jgi:hypothetical protein